MRVLISGGGTGGHVYPALAVVARLEQAALEARPGQPHHASVNPPSGPPPAQPATDPYDRQDRQRDPAELPPAVQASSRRQAAPFAAALGAQLLNGLSNPRLALHPGVTTAYAAAVALDPVAGLLHVQGMVSERGEEVSVRRSRSQAVETLWVGTVNGMERGLVERAGIAFRGIDTGQLRGINPLAALRNLVKMASGVQQSLRIIDEFQPDVCFVTGGYVCAPVVMACRLRRIPVLIYLPDMTPGFAIRWLSKLAQRVAVSFAEAAPWFGGERQLTGGRGKAVVTGYPVRQEVVAIAGNRRAARRQLALKLERPLDADGLPLVLVWGGSQGSRSINRATWAVLAELLPYAHVLHVIGTRDWSIYQEQELRLAPGQSHRYHPVAYLHDEMALALAAADLTVSRAGASALGEYPVARLPSILVPLTGVNQEDNAELLAKHGGALIVADDKLSTELAPALRKLIQQPEQRSSMEAALGRLAQPEAALQIARELCKLAN